MNKVLKNLYIAIFVVILSSFLSLSFYFSNIYKRLNNSLYDSLFRIFKKGNFQKTDSIKIIAIDDYTLLQFKENDYINWPLPRNIYGFISNYLIKYGAKAVVFDIVFSEPDLYDRENIGINGFGSDYYFYRVIEKTKKVVIPINIDSKYDLREIPDFIFSSDMNLINKMVSDSNQKDSYNQKIENFYEYIPEYDIYRLNAFNINKEERESIKIITNSYYIDKFLKNKKYESLINNTKYISDDYKYFRLPLSLFISENMGYVENVTDEDGIIREYKPLVKINDKYIPSLALSTYYLLNPDKKIKLNKNGNIILNWYGPGGVKTDEMGNIVNRPTFEYFSFYYVYSSAKLDFNKKEPLIKPENIKDKIFFVGNISRALLDQKNTPFSVNKSTFPGVETHATALANMINSDSLIILNILLELLLYLLPILLFTYLGLKVESLRFHTFVVVIFSSLVVIFQIFLFNMFNIKLNIIFFIIFVFLSVFISFVINYITIGRNRNLIRSAFGTYISPALEKEITESGKPLTITGEQVYATAMFIDIAGFTTFSEKNDAKKVVEILNIYLNYYSEIIINNNGFVNKFLGDGLMALFGTITYQNNHAELALKSAIECYKITKELEKDYNLKIRIGINSGEMIKGNMGGKRRLEFTAIGDTVNLASRLEGVNKFFKTNIIIGENTYKDLVNLKSDLIDNMLFIGRIYVKGKDIPIDIYTFVDKNDSNIENIGNLVKSYYINDRKRFLELIRYFEDNNLLDNGIVSFYHNYKDDLENFGKPIKFTEK